MRKHLLTTLTIHLAILLLLQLVSPIHSLDDPTDDEPGCKLQAGSGCNDEKPETTIPNGDITNHHLITLTDENFDELTWTPTPCTWLIMFKTDSCGICKKAMPAFESLSIDPALIEHNEKEWKSFKESSNVIQKVLEDGEPPRGPVYIATMDANWSGWDTTKRFNIDATPTIIVVHNGGYDDDMDDRRTYATYRGQRAAYPLRQFVLGGFTYRNRSALPPPLSKGESKPTSFLGWILDSAKPFFTWGGGLILKFFGAWFAFTGVLGLFMRIHNYAWGDDDDDERAERARKKEEEIAREKKEGSKYKISQSKEAEERQKKMMQRKLENRAKFAANRAEREKMREMMAKKKMQPREGGDDDDDFVGVGFAVKKSDIQEGKNSAGKLKSN